MREHDETCASRCTNWNGIDNDGPCDAGPHSCWCPEGSMTYDEYQRHLRTNVRAKWAEWEARKKAREQT